MSDVRRRKNMSDSTEGLSETSFEEAKKISDTESDVIDLNTTDGAADSEYETVEESGSESDNTVPSNRNSSIELSDKEDCQEGSVILDLERQSGDGEEQDNDKKKVDDDEDRSNPQYIPKRGTFYEHDDRTLEDGVPDGAESQTLDVEEESIANTEKAVVKPKKVWQQSQDRWSHDRYDEGEQAPKSRSELIAAYGYDIRNEEGPPKARRGHRYGHGPGKYTRNWEDIEAYGKPKITQRKPKPEDFPALNHEKDNDSVQSSEHKRTDDRVSIKPKYQQNKQNNEHRMRYNRNNKHNKLDRKEKQVCDYGENVQKQSNDKAADQDVRTKKYSNERQYSNNMGNDKRIINKPFKNRNTLEFKSQNRNKVSNSQINSLQTSDGPISNHYEQASNSEVQKNLYELQDTEDNMDNIVTQSFSNTKLKAEDNIANAKYIDNNKSTLTHNKSNIQSNTNNHRNSSNVPPRMQDAVRPKRYSCQRPGVVQEQNVQTQPQQQQQQQQQVYQQPNYYQPEYAPPVGNEQNNTHQAHIPQTLNTMPQPGAQVVPTNISVPRPQSIPYVPEPVPTQVMTTSNPVMPQQVLAQQYQPNSMQFTSGSPYMAPNNTFLPQSLAYPVPPPQHTPPTQYPPQYTQYPASAAFNAVPNPPPPGPTMFQPQGGITYYSPQGQPLPPRLAPRRPRSSAIPIVPPPQVAQESSSPTPEQSADSDNVHNIDHILDNMFVQRHHYDPSTSNSLCNINEKVQEMSLVEGCNTETVNTKPNEGETVEDQIQTCSEETCDVHNDISSVAT